MNDQIFCLDRCEAVAAMIADAFGETRGEGLKQEFVPVIQNELPRFIQAQQSVDNEWFATAHAQVIGNESPQIRRH